jgi:GPH family glycoside/pentoside/hexuronide:cation symporter
MTLAYIISDTLQTLVAVPFFTLTPEMTPDYDERTELTSYRMFFNLIASLGVAVATPMIKNWALSQGMTLSQSYILIAGLFGGLGALPFLVMFFIVRERHPKPTDTPPSLKEIAESAWENIPFRFATGLYMLNWMTVDMVSIILPYFLTYWIAEGNLTAEINLFGAAIAQDSVILGLLFLTAIAALPFWNWVSQKTSKRLAYMYGMGFWMVVQLLLIIVRPGQTILIITLTVLAGIGISTAHVLPDAIFPDVIEWERLRSKKSTEGVYYGTKNFTRKVTSAFTIFLVLQALNFAGYQSPPESALVFQQNDTALLIIRILTGPFGALLLLSSIIIAWFYPLTREKHTRIRKLLQRRDGRLQ